MIKIPIVLSVLAITSTLDQGIISLVGRQLPTFEKASIYNECGVNGNISALISYTYTEKFISGNVIIGHSGGKKTIPAETLKLKTRFKSIGSVGLTCSANIGEITFVGTSPDGADISAVYQIRFNKELEISYR